ncbi:MAG: hypothetical protein ACM3JH_08020 [Acidithiobacillales bacterium]
MTSRRLVSAGCLLALALTGCISTDAPPHDAFYPPSAPAASIEQLSGNYCYFGPDLSVRSFRRGTDLIPFLDVQKLRWPATIRVDATMERIVFTCTDESGYEEQQVFVPSQTRAVWLLDALVIGPGRSHGSTASSIVPEFIFGTVFNFWGLGERNRESRLFKSVDGQLVMTDSYLDSGWSRDRAGNGPYHYEKEDAVALILEPAAGDCAAAMPARPLQPRFEKGLDLREQACVDRLEEEFASILVAKGESEEAAGRLAGETVDSLTSEGEDWSKFWIESPSGVTYKFDVGKNEDGCILRLYGLFNKNKILFPGLEGNLSYLAKRPLPECTCVP